jgi:hypothetical protein
MKMVVFATLAVVTTMLSGCTGMKMGGGLGDPCSGMAAASSKAEKATTDEARQAAQAGYNEAVAICKQGLAQEGVDPCLAAKRIATYYNHNENSFGSDRQVIFDVLHKTEAACVGHNLYKSACAELTFLRQVQTRERELEPRRIPLLAQMWLDKDIKAGKACEAGDKDNNVSWGFTGESNNRCSEHNGQGLYRQVAEACGDFNEGVSASTITEILGYSRDNDKECADQRRVYLSWFNRCTAQYGNIEDPLSGNAKEVAKRKAEKAQQLKDEEALQTVCRSSNGNSQGRVQWNVFYVKEMQEKCSEGRLAQFSGALRDKMQEDCSVIRVKNSDTEFHCLEERATRLGLHPDTREMQAACPDRGNEWNVNKRSLGLDATADRYTCNTKFYAAQVEKAEAAKGIAGLSGADRIKKENAEMEKQLKALQGGK